MIYENSGPKVCDHHREAQIHGLSCLSLLAFILEVWGFSFCAESVTTFPTESHAISPYLFLSGDAELRLG